MPDFMIAFSRRARPQRVKRRRGADLIMHPLEPRSTEASRKDHNAERHMAEERSNVVIIGGGIMGGDIAIVYAANGWNVHVMSPSAKTREALPARMESG